MVTNDLLVFVRNSLNSGQSADQVRQALLAKGWQPTDVEQAIAMVTNPATVVPIPVSGRLRGPLELLGAAFGVVTERFVTLFVLSVIPGLIVVGLIFDMGLFAAMSLVTDSNLIITTGVVVLMMFCLLTFIFFAIWSSVAQLEAIMYRSERVGVIDAYRRSFGKIGSVFLVYLLVALVTAGASFLFMIPGMILGIAFGMTTYIVIEGKARGLNALIASRRLTQGFKWGIFGRMIVLGLVFVGMFLLVSIVIGIVEGILKPTLGDSVSKLVTSLLSQVITVPLTLVAMVYSVLMYEDLRAIKGEPTYDNPGKQRLGFVLLAIWSIVVYLIVFGSIIFIVFAFVSSDRAGFELYDNPDTIDTTDNDNQFNPGRFVARSALAAYFFDHDTYPRALEMLVPDYLDSVSADLTYRQLEDGADFELCFTNTIGEEKCERSSYSNLASPTPIESL